MKWSYDIPKVERDNHYQIDILKYKGIPSFSNPFQILCDLLNCPSNTWIPQLLYIQSMGTFHPSMVQYRSQGSKIQMFHLNNRDSFHTMRVDLSEMVKLLHISIQYYLPY